MGILQNTETHLPLSHLLDNFFSQLNTADTKAGRDLPLRPQADKKVSIAVKLRYESIDAICFEGCHSDNPLMMNFLKLLNSQIDL